MNRLFKTKVKLGTFCDPDAEIIWTEAPYIEFEQIRLSDNIRQYLEAALISTNVFRTGIKNTLLEII